MDKCTIMYSLSIAKEALEQEPLTNVTLLNKVNSELNTIKEEYNEYTLAKKQALLFRDEFNSNNNDAVAEAYYDNKEFKVIVMISNFSENLFNLREELFNKYLLDCAKCITFKYTQAVYYSNLH